MAGLTLNIASRSVSLGAAASVRSEVPLITRLSTVAVTTSVVFTSLTVRVPLLVRVVSVSVRPALSGPSLIIGASLLPVMVMVTVSVSLNGVASSSVACTV